MNCEATMREGEVMGMGPIELRERVLLTLMFWIYDGAYDDLLDIPI